MIYFIKNCLQGLWINRVRSVLTGVGVLVGVASVVVIVVVSHSFLIGATDERSDRRLIDLTSSAETDQDVVSAASSVAILSKVTEIAARTDVDSFTRLSPRKVVTVRVRNGEVLGELVTEFTDEVPIVEGCDFSQVAGNAVVFFRNPEYDNIHPGDEVVINGSVFTVAGLTDSLGASGDTRLFLPARLEGLISVTESEYAASYELIAADRSRVNEVTASVLAQLNADLEPGLKFVDFSGDVRAAMQEAFVSIQVVLGLIASISLVVAASNVVNTMYVATLERRGEIAVLRSLGMTRREIVALFIFESAVVVAFFAVLGFLAGQLLAWIALMILGIDIVFATNSVWVVGLVTIVVGIGGGAQPAFKAARIDPVILLR